MARVLTAIALVTLGAATQQPVLPAVVRTVAEHGAVQSSDGRLTAGQQTTFKVSADTVVVYATVQGRKGQVVPRLASSDFRVLEDGRPTSVVLFSDEPQPITAAVMISVALLGRGLSRVQGAARAFLDLLTPDDRVAIGAIGPEVTVSAVLPPTDPELRRVLAEELWWGPADPLWMGLNRAMSGLGRATGRRVLLVLTDDVGRNGCRPLWMGAACSSLEQVVTRVEAEDTLVYQVRFGGAMEEQRPAEIKGMSWNPLLKDLVDRTGGLGVDVGDADDVTEVFGRIVSDLRQQYVLAFRPRAFDGKRHTIRVEVTRPGLTVRARTTYQAPRRQ